ncbi:LysR family transcriptional regulator [Brachybacterium sacelli]|uniref:LysR family transcriptional regulator n=1 Tax=Brachybacterium sacelli TaxID=173364 RepID=UPI001AE79987
MDVVQAWQVVVAVDDYGSISAAADVLALAQPVASRRVLHLEEELGVRLLERGGRGTRPTAVGRSLLPTARRLLEAAAALEAEAAHARRRPWRLGIPRTWSDLDAARLLTALGPDAPEIDLHRAAPTDRLDALQDGGADAALLPAAPDEEAWRQPLGLATAHSQHGSVHLEELRPRRTTVRRTRILLDEEDEVAHVRGRLEQAMDMHGLAADQLAPRGDRARALADLALHGDLLLCTAREARDIGCTWRPLDGIDLHRTSRLELGVGSSLGERTDLVREAFGAVLENEPS